MAIVSRSLLVREALARRLTLLGVEVTAVARFDDLAREIRNNRPDSVLVDGDGWEWPWEALLRDLELRKRGIPALLLISSMSAGQALETPTLGIGAVILKPFKPEEHTARVYDLLLETQAVTARRAHPRYVPADGQAVVMEALPYGDWVVLRLPVLDVSGGGARLELPDAAVAAALAPGSRGAVASLVVENARTSVAFRVVHRARQTLGVAFEKNVDLQGFDRRVFGPFVPLRLW
jgi:CheY-like chemotaxis protein